MISYLEKTPSPLKRPIIIYRVSLSLEAPNYCLYIQVNTAGFSFVNTGKQVHLKHARRHFERNLGERRVPSKSCIQKLVKKLRDRGSRSNACRLLSLGAYWRAKCTKIHPRTIEQLKDAIRQDIQAVNVDTLGKVFQNLEKRITVFLGVKGDQFQHWLWTGPVLHRSRYVYINFQVILSQ